MDGNALKSKFTITSTIENNSNEENDGEQQMKPMCIFTKLYKNLKMREKKACIESVNRNRSLK